MAGGQPAFVGQVGGVWRQWQEVYRLGGMEEWEARLMCDGIYS